MPTVIQSEAIATYAPVIAVLAEQLELEAESALTASTEAQQLLRVGGIQALTQLLSRESARLTDSVRDPAPSASPAAEE